MVIFGGIHDVRNEVYALSLSGTPEWTNLYPAGPIPGGRQGHAAIYDPLGHRMIVFGGGAHSSGISSYYNDVWALSLTDTPSWTQIATAGMPPDAREGHTAVYDALRDRMVVFGGFTSPGPVYFNDAWALSLRGTPTWTQLLPSGAAPRQRYGHTAIYDPVRDRMVVFGGDDNTDLLTYFSDTWMLNWDHTTATLLARFEAVAMAAGIQIRWQFGQPERVSAVTLERSRNQRGSWTPIAIETVSATEVLDQTAAAGETYYYRLTANFTDGTRATFGPISTATPQSVKVSGLTGIAPNPTSSSARIDFALAHDEKVRISVLDVTGREAAVLAEAPMAPGRYSLVWDGKSGRTRLPAGMYFVRWESPGRMMTRRIVLTR
jgi:hypothetical protein